MVHVDVGTPGIPVREVLLEIVAHSMAGAVMAPRIVVQAAIGYMGPARSSMSNVSRGIVFNYIRKELATVSKKMRD